MADSMGLAGRTDLWLGLRPNTDAALALALGSANLLIELGWYDRDFISD
jgi:anaerobic selenocysteine-containing dehydrogenase